MLVVQNVQSNDVIASEAKQSPLTFVSLSGVTPKSVSG
jgi:hypothetical protein